MPGLRTLGCVIALAACRPTHTPARQPPEPPAAVKPTARHVAPVVATTPGAIAIEPGCRPFDAVKDRHERDLIVPAAPTPEPGASFKVGRNVVGETRRWVGPPVPATVPLYVGDAELSEVQRAGEDFVAVYRTPSKPGCHVTERGACELVAKAFDRCGVATWTVDLGAVMSREGLDTHGVLYADGVLYVNEACVPADTKPKGRCGALVAIDPTTGSTKWRTAAMVSSSGLLLHQGLIVTVYMYLGQTAWVHLVRATDGEIVLRQKVEGGNWDLKIAEDGHLQLAAFGDSRMHYVMSAWDTDKPRLVRVPGYAG